MDGSRFDDLTRVLALSRRGVLKHLVAGLLAGAGGLLGADRAAAQGCAPVRGRCAADADCCSGACDPASSSCVCGAGTEECGRDCLPLDQYQSDVENCGGCRVRCRRAPECQLPACLAGVCGNVPDPAQAGQPCGRGGEVCGADGTCACPPEVPTACQSGCVDTTIDPRNCGACDNRCPGTGHDSAVCAGGVCGIACDAGYVACGDRCCPADRECCNGDCCGPNQCCTAEGCVRCRCEIGIESYDAGEVNPDNPCQFCDPTRNTSDWTIAADGTFCGEGRVCCNGECCSPTECCDGVQCTVAACPDQCQIQGQPVEAGDVNDANACQVCDPEQIRFDWTLVDDQMPCGGVPGRVCCNGECCSPTECCGATSCEECGPHCRIGNADIDAGDVNPANECEVCNPEADFDGWSPAPDDADCGVGQFCCAGQCCSSGECCNEGTCGECRCEIGVDGVDRDAVNPLNKCQICDPDRDRDDWSPGPNNSACGLTNDRFCCAGDCCPADECCNAIGECEPCGCVISGNPVLEDAVNPANTCQACDPDRDRRGWTVLDDGEACGGEADDRVCCGGTCCPQGECCADGACQPCGCEIGDDPPIDPRTINPENVCQICDPSRARLAWSPVDNGTPCGPGGAQRCCGGECCAEDECCILDACGTCLCSIGGGDNIIPDTRNPDNPCELCDPDRDPFGWSTAPDDTACGDDQVCCAGSCCDPGQCCTLGVCGQCGCRIGETDVAEFAINPDNACEWCDPVLDPLAWSPRSDEPCGDGQVCCGGVCCERGQCCNLNDVCEACDCHIGEEFHDAGKVNDANSCEICDPTQSTDAWTSLADDTPCGDGDQVCCAGECCPPGECCTLNVCGPCGCEIDGQTADAFAVNPANVCQVCDPVLDRFAWSPNEGAFCGAGGSQVCCGGVCCPEGDCCSLVGVCEPCDGCTIDGVRYDAGARNPSNRFCQVCDPTRSTTSWSAGPDDVPCALDAPQVCCNGVCCAISECCDAGSGACGVEFCEPEVCTIDGVVYENFTLNPQNECEHCNAFLSTTTWSFNGFAGCGPTGQQFCNSQGVCCPLGICPDLTVPGFCGDFCDAVCVIEGVLYHSGDHNPAEDCQVCSTLFSHTSWTTICSDSCCATLPCDHCP